VIEAIKRFFQRVQPVSADTLRVLMVCTANVCRSPAAEAVFRQKLQQAGLAQRVRVDSAGTHGYKTGEAPDPRAVAAGQKRGFELGKLRARPVTAQDFERFDWVLAMDTDHLAWLQAKAAETQATAPLQGPKIELLMNYARRPLGLDSVPDPYYGGPSGFDRVFDLVEDACDGLVARILAREPGSKLD